MQILWSIFDVVLATAPYLLFGLFLAGWLKIVLRTEGVERFLGGRNLRSALWASLLGLPLPICSCGVVPVALGLKDKKASRESSLAFLISTPETSVDTVAVTWGLLGPLMAIVRPIAAFLTSMFAAVLSIAARTDAVDEHPPPSSAPVCESPCCDDEPAEPYHVVGFGGLMASLRSALRIDGNLPHVDEDGGAEPSCKTCDGEAADDPGPVPLSVLSRDAMHYGFVRMFDDLSPWLVIGLIVAGALSALVPSNWIANVPGGEIGAMVFVLLIGVPMYVCAVESTPIAAVLIAKGLSPGAALVFLLAGPATNTATILLLERTFGRRFLKIYLTAIAIASIACGLLLNRFLSATGWSVIPRIRTESGLTFFTFVSIGSALLLAGLVVASFSRLNWKAKWKSTREFGARLAALFGLVAPGRAGAPRVGARSLLGGLIVLVVLGFLASGLYRVPPGSAGYEFRFGRLTSADLPPGLHYRLPWPMERTEVYRIDYARKSDLGFRTDMNWIAQWKKQPTSFRGTGWHSFFTEMDSRTDESLYLLGDENQVEAKFAIHYTLNNPKAFFFDYAKNKDLVTLAVESTAREILARVRIDDLLAPRRGDVARELAERAQALLDRYGIGVTLTGLFLVDLHPPVESVAAFRDVASAKEDRETRIHDAFAAREQGLPLARGGAVLLTAQAEADRAERIAESRGREDSFVARSDAYRANRTATEFRMFLETMERRLPSVRTVVVPPEAAPNAALRFWIGQPPTPDELTSKGSTK